MKLRIGILGTRGIPNQYGGFEQFAAYLSKGLVVRGHDVTVYSPHDHPYKEKDWMGVRIMHCYDPGSLIGTAGQFIYDLNCIIDARKKQFDVLLILGYTSSSVWGRWYPRKSIVITNMDGLEWKRSKYSPPVQRFLRYAEKLAMRHSDHHVADSLAIQEYLLDKYKILADHISYGAELRMEINEEVLKRYHVSKGNFLLVIARMEPENNIETILEGICKMNEPKQVLVIGGFENKYGKKMFRQFNNSTNIHFLGTEYDPVILNTLRHCCLLYFHGHSVGGTNPSLLEAMAAGALICAHDNVFNRAILKNNAFYFNSATDIRQLAVGSLRDSDMCREFIVQNKETIYKDHSWDKIVGAYEKLFIQSYQVTK